MPPVLLTYDQVRDMHRRLVSLTGDPFDLRDENLLRSALAAPENGRLYNEDDLYAMAASYAFHLSCNHPFIEGNKRIGAMAADVFLTLNRVSFTPDPEEYATKILKLVLGEITQAELAEYYRRNSITRS